MNLQNIKRVVKALRLSTVECVTIGAVLFVGLALVGLILFGALAFVGLLCTHPIIALVSALGVSIVIMAIVKICRNEVD